MLAVEIYAAIRRFVISDSKSRRKVARMACTSASAIVTRISKVPQASLRWLLSR